MKNIFQSIWLDHSGRNSFSSDGGQGVLSWKLLIDGNIVVSVCASNTFEL
jgi:hypothetical protein